MNYKAPDNSLHFIDPEHAHLLPIGSIQISEVQAEKIRKSNEPKIDKKAVAIQEAKTYLQETDWYVTRLSETKKAIPADVAKKREASRNLIK
jgi:hypothetical protein